MTNLSMTIFTFAWWWGLQCGGASCARAHCTHWIIRPWC